ncbi:STAS domain-containing protein [Rhodobacter sp. Har01]|uniref:STAS domain-containing protein n=1 Tax=Rhodobacter sp. Har01 TaxID=2883999 RepID=UPI001D088D64|nr:STAS domain-containing protein [Rhodobacter sp. Har01]MCB6176784.1 STAS domain-containing protein [Rhodobacter sp. Har01]
MIDFDLPERVSVAGDNALVPFLRQHPDAPLRIHANRLRRLDTPLVQTLLAAAADRRRRGIDFVLTGLSSAQADQLAALGVTTAVLPMELAE